MTLAGMPIRIAGRGAQGTNIEQLRREIKENILKTIAESGVSELLDQVVYRSSPRKRNPEVKVAWIPLARE